MKQSVEFQRVRGDVLTELLFSFLEKSRDVSLVVKGQGSKTLQVVAEGRIELPTYGL